MIHLVKATVVLYAVIDIDW